MSKVIMIAAVAKNYIIGNKGQIPWYISADFQHFKEKTLGYPCVMGDVTFESLPNGSRPLPGRENVILTLDKDYKAEGATIFHDYEKALEYCKQKYDKVYITGGATIYRLGMQYADELEITRVDKDYEGDASFPEIKEDEWEEVSREEHFDEKENVKFSFVTYRRKN
ncbi:dihydrofolate reductase [Candidatus Woesearchaeota archaeon]|nr:dihydrofolate reductase [Candidatus Woesearchaeota archaeon]